MRNASRIVILVVSVFCILFSTSTISFADGSRILMCNMHELESDHVKVLDKEITDSYGNKYSANIVEFNAHMEAFATYDLNGAYDSFNATLVCSDEAYSGTAIDVGIFADGVLIYSLKNYTRQQPPESISLDVSGVGKLTIMTLIVEGEYNRIYFVDSYFSKSNNPTIYPTRWELKDLVMIDSDRINTVETMIIDPFGDLHKGKVRMKPSARYDSYAMYNLNSSYSVFSGTVIADVDMDSKGIGSIIFYVDDSEVFSIDEITRTTEGVPFEISVENGKVLKIVATNDSDYSCYINVTDTLLKVHEHTLSEWEPVLDPTCTSPGKRHQICTECGEEIYSEMIPPLGHTPDGIWETVRDATCSTEGEEVQHCSVCHEICDSRPIAVIPHTPLNQWEDEKDPTCVEQGSRVRRCSECGVVVEREYIDTIAHDFSDWEVVSGNIWDNPIEKERICSMCGKVETEESYPTPWLKPLVIVGVLILVGGAVAIGIIIKTHNLHTRPSNAKKAQPRPATNGNIGKTINISNSSSGKTNLSQVNGKSKDTVYDSHSEHSSESTGMTETANQSADCSRQPSSQSTTIYK